MTNYIADPQDAASVTIITLGYRARCAAPSMWEPSARDPAVRRRWRSAVC